MRLRFRGSDCGIVGYGTSEFHQNIGNALPDYKVS
jgi:hypothetical protein